MTPTNIDESQTFIDKEPKRVRKKISLLQIYLTERKILLICGHKHPERMCVFEIVDWADKRILDH